VLYVLLPPLSAFVQGLVLCAAHRGRAYTGRATGCGLPAGVSGLRTVVGVAGTGVLDGM
jgi:hypothetical protein